MTGGTEKIEVLKPIGYRLVLSIILLLGILTHSVIRDVRLEQQYAGDLRNRVVGARLQKDGRLPYFYLWQAKDGIRYYDPFNTNRKKDSPSPITASPFFHQLLYPLCDLDQRTVSKCWFVIQWFLLFAMTWIACRMTQSDFIRWLMIYAAVLFTTTEAWKSNIANGQIYFFYAFLMLCIISGLMSNKKFRIIVSGFIMAAWILNRPIGMVVLLPMILLFKQQRVFLISAMSFLLLYGLFVLVSPFEKSLWRNYLDGMRSQVKFHQSIDPKAKLPPQIVPADRKMEGIDFDEVDRNMAEHPIKVYSENGNFFVIYHQLTHHQISVTALNCLLLLSVLSLLISFFYIHTKDKRNLLQVLIFGFTLYMIVELFSPIYRHQYNTVQWFPLILSALLIPAGRKNPVLFLLALGLLLNIINTGWIPMRHTMGEYVWLLALLYFSFAHVDKTNPEIGNLAVGF